MLDQQRKITIMAGKMILWDSVAHLQTEEDIADYLAASLKTGEAPDLTHARARATIEYCAL